MKGPSDSLFSVPRIDYYENVILSLIQIRDQNSSGRLSIRNVERFGLAHLYFQRSRLTHVAGDKRHAEEVLQELLTWSKGQVRFDTAVVVDHETLTWQQTDLFAHWLALLEMRGATYSITHAQVTGLARQLTQALPQKPITLPERIAHYEEHEIVTQEQQLQRFSESVSLLVERTLPAEQREQLLHLSTVAVQRAGRIVRRASHAAQELTTRLAKNLHEDA